MTLSTQGNLAVSTTTCENAASHLQDLHISQLDRQHVRLQRLSALLTARGLTQQEMCSRVTVSTPRRHAVRAVSGWMYLLIVPLPRALGLLGSPLLLFGFPLHPVPFVPDMQHPSISHGCLAPGGRCTPRLRQSHWHLLLRRREGY